MTNKDDAIEQLLNIINRLTNDDNEIYVSIEKDEVYRQEGEESIIVESTNTIKITERF